MSVTNEQILKAVESLRVEIKQINGRVRVVEQDNAGFKQWRRDHEENVNDVQSDEIKSLQKRINVWSSLLSLGELIIAALLAALFGK